MTRWASGVVAPSHKPAQASEALIRRGFVIPAYAGMTTSNLISASLTLSGLWSRWLKGCLSEDSRS
jgi:hypothetical protein